MQRISALGCKPELRQAGAGPYETDNGNYILDCRFEGVDNAAETEKRVKLIPGVLGCGPLIGIADVLVLGRPGGGGVRDRPRTSGVSHFRVCHFFAAS